ncbi:MAG: cysteine desulfurase NifS [Candidatus Omnitrophica bacterium]|nr:cysteine desulfurase NifS [Candidatus Omnitrophota bacterium]
MSVIYLDNNATTRVAPEVKEAILPFLEDLYGNPSSPHHFGGQIEKHLTLARQSVAALLGCSPKEVFFTSGGTESDNLAIRGVLAARPDKRHIVTTAVEHSAVLVQCRELVRQGYRVDFLPVDCQGRLDPSDVERAIHEDTGIVSIMWANNETGVIFPIPEIASICKARKVPLHVDAVQAVGKTPIDLRAVPIDLLSLSGHKIHAPKGVGVLFVRTGMRMKPILWGGHQERGKRPGTEPVPLIAGLGKAAELALARLETEQTEVARLRDKLQRGLVETVPNLILNGAEAPRLPNTLNVCFRGVEGEALLLLMDQHGIAASSGSACLADKLEPSHVLLAMGVSEADAMGAVRFSLSRYTTEAEIDRALGVLPALNEKVLRLADRVAV